MTDAKEHDCKQKKKDRIIKFSAKKLTNSNWITDITIDKIIGKDTMMLESNKYDDDE